jgi:phospholipid-binding lipoprotein MlaA
MQTGYKGFVLSFLCCIALIPVPSASSQEFSPPAEISDLSSSNDGEVLLAQADASPQEPEEPPESNARQEMLADPLEPVNRVFFQFNDKLYFWVLKPVASGYRAVVHQDIRVGVRNFFSNLLTPVRFVNCLLQANFKGAGTETARFALNSTFGLAGFLDPAKKEFHLEKKEEDFGQTLGVWGIGPAFYINWPILGPSSLRDSFGFVGDMFLDPLTYLDASTPVKLAIRSFDRVNDTSLRIGDYEDLKKDALDPYVALKDIYDQYRRNKIKER